jgi:hypothetical protein
MVRGVRVPTVDRNWKAIARLVQRLGAELSQLPANPSAVPDQAAGPDELRHLARLGALCRRSCTDGRGPVRRSARLPVATDHPDWFKPAATDAVANRDNRQAAGRRRALRVPSISLGHSLGQIPVQTVL